MRKFKTAFHESWYYVLGPGARSRKVAWVLLPVSLVTFLFFVAILAPCDRLTDPRSKP